jgi:AcrR family transcriptional regulator
MPKPKDENKIPLIYDATLKLLLKKGYGSLKMAEVAKLACVATGTIYTYFKNKNDLLNSMFKELKKGKMEEVFSGFNPDSSFYEGFKLLWSNYLKAGLRNPERNIFIDLYEQSEHLDEESKTISFNSPQTTV